jgi:nitrogen fixation NifU-like protein
MTDDLYQQAIKDLAARDSERLDPADGSATLDNPLCKAAAAVVTDTAGGMDSPGAARLLDGVRAMLKQGAEPPLPALAPFLAARPHKSRHDCVLLPFKALAKALSN